MIIQLNDVLKYGLEKLEMICESDQISGLVEVNDISNINTHQLSAEEIIAIENAQKYKANYIYFRRFKDRPSVPLIYIYDFTNSIDIDEQELIKLHTKLYSSGQVPMFFVFTKKDVRIFNCYDRPAEGNQFLYKPLTTIKLAAELLDELDVYKQIENENKFKSFSGRSFDNGTFWENSDYSKSFKFSNSAYEKLLIELKQALKDIIVKKILPENVARRIMVISILVKYLEERIDDNGNSVFPDKFFSQFSLGANCFADILKEAGAVVKLFDYLAKHFNGGVFLLKDVERAILEDVDLRRFGLFLEGKLDGFQYVFWRLYSFNDLPVELISNIYEEFLEKKPGVVYTPPYLVNLLLDETMPLNDINTDVKILDPACGSGVFLVGAYRRLVYRWRQGHNWQKPNLELLKKLLKDCIFGVDKDEDAVNLTIFSLSLALCDELTPLQIWEELKFDDLNEKNIINDDFFNIVLDKQYVKEFDLVIGNPPFIQSQLTPAAEEVERFEYKRRILVINGKKKKVSLPRKQIALLFLEQSVIFCKKGGITCLVQSSAPLLYNKSSIDFRRVLLEKYFIPQIIDFTHIARVLFGANGDVPTAAIFIKNEPAKEKGLLHIIPRRTKPHKEKLYFDLDSYDFHYVPRKLALNDALIWKSNYLGGSRYHQLTKKLKQFTRLKDYLSSRSWDYGSGIRVGNENEIKRLEYLNTINSSNISVDESVEKLELEKIYIELTSFQEISSFDYLHTSGLDSNGIDSNQITQFPYKYCENYKNTSIYYGPHILIKEGISEHRLTVSFTEKDLLFKEKIVGIHSPDIEALKKVAEYLKSNIVSYYLAGTSAEYLVRRATSIKKLDIDNIPFDDNINDYIDSFDNILIEDFFNYLIEFRANGENSKLLTQNANATNLDMFSDTYCEVLSSIYPTIQPYQRFETDSYICFPFYFGNKPDIEFGDEKTAEKYLEKLVKRTSGISLRLTRIVRVYEKNVIYLIKPKKLRYWLRSIALRDADETFVDLRKQGY